MLSEIWKGIGDFFSLICAMLGLSGGGGGAAVVGKNTLRVFIKHHHGGTDTLPVDLDPTSSIREVKRDIAPQLGLRPEEIKIIFAGKELPDELILQVLPHSIQLYNV
jgi:hypothetical protein